ncbi:MAG: peroxiredoxin [Planctomycetaceae bacterium]|nr:peroxiredoxin [Planctomycetaceae bacterium]
MANSLDVGDRVPDFSVSTAAGDALRLSEILQERAVVLFFYPKNETAICTKEACAFRDSFEKFAEAGAEVIGVSGDADASHQTFAQRHRLPFHLVSDADGTLRRLLGVPKTLGVLPGRVTYVIDRSQTVRLKFSAQLASDEHVKRALTALRPSGGDSET